MAYQFDRSILNISAEDVNDLYLALVTQNPFAVMLVRFDFDAQPQQYFYPNEEGVAPNPVFCKLLNQTSSTPHISPFPRHARS